MLTHFSFAEYIQLQSIILIAAVHSASIQQNAIASILEGTTDNQWVGLTSSLKQSFLEINVIQVLVSEKIYIPSQNISHRTAEGPVPVSLGNEIFHMRKCTQHKLGISCYFISCYFQNCWVLFWWNGSTGCFVEHFAAEIENV